MFYHKHHHRFHRHYLKGWEETNNPNVLSIKRKRVIGALITFPFPQLTPPISREGEDTLKVVSWENPQSTCRQSIMHSPSHIHTHTLQKFTAATSKRTYSTLYFEAEGFYEKKKKKMAREWWVLMQKLPPWCCGVVGRCQVLLGHSWWIWTHQ